MKTTYATKKSSIIIMLFLLCIKLSAQVEYGEIITAKYATFYDWNYYSQEYEINEEITGWADVAMLPEREYYVINHGDGNTKIWWEYDLSNSDEDSDVYYTQDHRKIVFHYIDQRIAFYYDHDGHERYKKILIISKIEKAD